MKKTVNRTDVLISIREEAGRVMRSFLDGEILRNTLIGAIGSLYVLEIQHAKKHELAAIHCTLTRHADEGEDSEVTMRYVRDIFSKSKSF